jgi:para-aminobenzoate synthetase/4-amino-4-deoxychorismate lyase
MDLTAPFVLLEDRLAPQASGWLYEHPHGMVRCDTPDAVEDGFLRLQAGLDRGLHAAGFLAYELGYGLEPRLGALMPALKTPLIWMGLFAPPRAVDAAELDARFAAAGPAPPITRLEAGHCAQTHEAKAREILELIAAGDIYQANLTFPMRFRYEADPLRLYAAMRVLQPTAHGGVVAFDDTFVLSVSPELFLEVENGRATGRPMKGTAARSPDPQADEDAAHALLADPKQRAENLMIVDLIRNDLARIAKPGSVRTPRLFTVETYPHLHTLTSTVTAKLRPDLSLRERLAAVFPCGSIVGAPKIRAAQVLAELETGPRGVYTGAVGAFAPGGDLKLNVAIRTVVLRDGAGVYGVGGGVVADSDPKAEYEEACLKARLLDDLARDYDLIETFGWSPDRGFVRLALHLDRLEASAAALGFAFHRQDAEAALTQRALGWAQTPAADRRVRVQLLRAGDLEIEDAPAPIRDGRCLRLGLAHVRLDAGDPFLRHKTTRRWAYDAASAQARAVGWDEGVLLNQRGEVADAAWNSVFVQAGGRLATPPLSAGALAGVLRQALISTGLAVEARLTPESLAQAEAVFLGNSLRGLRRAKWMRPGSD